MSWLWHLCSDNCPGIRSMSSLLALCTLSKFCTLLMSAVFFPQNLCSDIPSVSSSVNWDQAWNIVGPYQGSNCLKFYQQTTLAGRVNPLLHRLFFRSWHHFHIFRQTWKRSRKIYATCKVFNTIENIMENGAFAPKEHMLHFPYFQVRLCLKGVKRHHYGVRG